MQGDDGLAGAGAAVDDEGATGARPDDGVLVGLDGGEHVPHPVRPVAAEARDERGLVVERRVPFEPVGGEHLVPVVADPAVGPAVPAAARQAHRAGVRGREERLGRGGTPVDQQTPAFAVGEAEPSDVHGLGAVGADDPTEAQVQAEAAQGAQASGEPVDLQVPVHGPAADAAGRPAGGFEAVGQLGDGLLQARRDGGEVPLVGGDQRGVGLRGEVVGEVERAGAHRVRRRRRGHGGHGIGRQAHYVVLPFPQVLGSGRGYSPIRGALPQDPLCAIS